MDEKPEQPEIAPPPLKTQQTGFEQFAATAPPPPTSEFQYAADKIGFVPNVRKDDNKFQGLAVLGGIVLGAVIFMIGRWTGEWWGDAIVGGVLGMIAGTLISGMILAVRGLKR